MISLLIRIFVIGVVFYFARKMITKALIGAGIMRPNNTVKGPKESDEILEICNKCGQVKDKGRFHRCP